MSLAPGARLGPYEIVAPLGAGGMGEVYRARDTRLGRTVAIKILPEAASADLDRRQRFFVTQALPLPPARPVTHIDLVFNWVEELKAKVAAAR
jgi:serine/threonine protein kinase